MAPFMKVFGRTMSFSMHKKLLQERLLPS
jgi:hypothetical protein